MKGSRINYKESEKEMEAKISSEGAKYFLPKLKSYSQDTVNTYSHLNLKATPYSHYHFSHERSPTEHIASNQTQVSKISVVKCQYVSKSPAYFRRQERGSINSVRIDDRSYHQPVESYVESKIKQFNKQALLDLVNSRTKMLTQSNSKLITNQQTTTTNQNTINSRINKTKINYNKLKEVRSSQKFSNLAKDGRLTLKPFNIIQLSEQSRISKIGTNAKNTLIQKGFIVIKQKAQNHPQKSSRNLHTLQHKKIEFYDTKYSNFEPNKIENVKNHIKNIKKYPSLKLNLYNLQ